MSRNRNLLSLAAAGLLATTLAACGSSTAGTTGAATASASAGVTASPSPVADINTLTGVSTAVALDSGFVSALQTLGLTPGTVGDATLSNGTITFPITGGNVTYYQPGTVDPYVQGMIEHSGSGLSLTAGDTKVELTNFVIDPGASKLYGDVSVNGTTAAKQAYLFFLDGSTLQPLKTQNGQAILTGTHVEISPDAAMLLNKTFNTTAVQPNLLVGVATITIALPKQ